MTSKDVTETENFPEFLKKEENKVPKEKQNTADIEGYYYTANDGCQAAVFTCFEDRVSKEHTHPYDEYMVCLDGEYVLIINGKETVLHKGDEYLIEKGSLQGARIKKGTRTMHIFGGNRFN